MYTHLNGIHYGNCILYGDSIMNPVEMCVHVMRLKVLLLNGFQRGKEQLQKEVWNYGTEAGNVRQ